MLGPPPPPHDVVFNGLIQVLVLFVEYGKIGIFHPGCPEQELSGDAGDRYGGLKDVNTFLEIKLLEVFYSFDEWLDIQVIVPDEKVPKGLHLVVSPDFLAVLVFFLRNVASF